MYSRCIIVDNDPCFDFIWGDWTIASQQIPVTKTSHCYISILYAVGPIFGEREREIIA